MNIDNKFSKCAGTTQLRSTSQKAPGEITPWPELEVLSREKLIQMIYKDNRAGSWTMGSKVSLICRVHCLQQADFVFSRRNELEALSLREYRKWRMENESLLGSTSDPDSSKYLLMPPNLFTGEYLYFGFEVLMALKRDVLIDYIRDHFCGYSTNLIKGRLACRIRVLLRFPRDDLDASELSIYEEEQLDALRNHLSNMEIVKAEDKQAKQRVVVDKEAKQKQSLITGSFVRQQKAKVQCVMCHGVISMLGHQARRDKCSVCTARDKVDSAEVKSAGNIAGVVSRVDADLAADWAQEKDVRRDEDCLGSGTELQQDQIWLQQRNSEVKTSYVTAPQDVATTVADASYVLDSTGEEEVGGLKGCLRSGQDQKSVRSGELLSAGQLESGGETADSDDLLDAVIAGSDGDLGLDPTEEEDAGAGSRQDQKLVQSGERVAVGQRRVEGEKADSDESLDMATINENGGYDADQTPMEDAGDPNSPAGGSIDSLLDQRPAHLGVEAEQLGLKVEMRRKDAFESFDPMAHRRQARSLSEELLQCGGCKVKVLIVAGGHTDAKCAECVRRSAESTIGVSPLQSQDAGQTNSNQRSDLITTQGLLTGVGEKGLVHLVRGGELNTSAEDIASVKRVEVDDQHQDLGTKISGVLREIEKSTKESFNNGEAMEVVSSVLISSERMLRGDVLEAAPVASLLLGGLVLRSEETCLPGSTGSVVGQEGCVGQADEMSGSLDIGSTLSTDTQGGLEDAFRTDLQSVGLLSPSTGCVTVSREEDVDSSEKRAPAIGECPRKDGIVQPGSVMVSNDAVLVAQVAGRISTGGTKASCGQDSREKSIEGSQRNMAAGAVELNRLVMMYGSTSEDEESDGTAQLARAGHKTPEGSKRAGGRMWKGLTPSARGATARASGLGIPVPVAGMPVPSWDSLLRGRTAAELRGYLQTHFPHVNAECSSPTVAAKIRILLERLPVAVTNEELEVMVRSDGDGYKEWYQSSVLGRSSSSVTKMTTDEPKVVLGTDSTSLLSPRRFPTWADISSDEDDTAKDGIGEGSALTGASGDSDSMDRNFLLAARLVLLGQAENKKEGSIREEGEDPRSASPSGGESMREPGRGGSTDVGKEGFSSVVLPVESDWVGAAAYMEYSRLIVHQPDTDASGRSRGLLLSSMTEAMRIVTCHDFSAGPCHAAILEKRHMQCATGWSVRLISLASPGMGEAIRLEVGEESPKTVEFVFELYYRHFFSRPNSFHFRYGIVFASMHGYQIQIWTVTKEQKYTLVVSYGGGIVVSRWLVRDLAEDTSRVELLLETKRVKLEGFDTGRLSDRCIQQCRERLVCALESSGGEGGLIIEGCSISRADLLQFGRGGKVSDGIMAAWSRVCQRVNSVRYIMSSKSKEYIDSVWFLPPSFFHSVLLQEDGAIIGYDLLGFPLLLTDVERLRAKILFAPYCPHKGRWGAGVLHIRERDVGYLEHGHSYSLHPSTALFLQAMREWFDCQYALKYDVSLIASTAKAWTITHGLGSESFGSDDYDSGAQLLLEMLILAMGTQGSMEVTRVQLDQFRWYVVLVLGLPDLRRDEWVQKVSFEICEPAILCEAVGSLSREGEASKSMLSDNMVGDNGSTHSFDFRCDAEKVSEKTTDLLEPMRLRKFPVGLLLELSQALTESVTYAEMWLVEHDREHRRIVQSMMTPASVALGASDFSVRELATLLEAEIFVASGAPLDEIDFLTSQVTLDWWLWANLCSKKKFCEMMCARFPETSRSSIEKLWRRKDINKSRFTLVQVESEQSMRMEAPILGFLSSTFPVVMRVLMRDLDESPNSQGLYRLGKSLPGAINLHSLTVERGVLVESCDLRMRDAFERLQAFVEGIRLYSLEGSKVAVQLVVRMSEWRLQRRPNAVAEQFDMLMFATWWRSNMICDIRLTCAKVSLCPLEVLLMLERLEVDSKVVHSLSVDLKQVHLLRSLKSKLMGSVDPVAKEAVQSVDRVVELLLDKRVSEAREVWRSTRLDGAATVKLCRELFPKFTREGRWEDQVVYIPQTAVLVHRMVVLTADGATITVGLPEESVSMILQAMDRQVMHAAVLSSNYGISAEVSLGKYWSMPRGIKLQWLDDGKRMDEVLSRKDLLRNVLVSGLEEDRPLWMVLGLAPLLDTMVRLSYVDGASFSQSDITSVRVRDSLRTLVASDRATVISFSQADSDYPLGVVGSYGRRTLESMSKDPSSVVSRLVQKAREGRSLDLFTVDHYSTPAEYSTKMLRSMFSMLQWLSEHNIVSTRTTIEFKNVRASEMTEAFYKLLGKDFVTSRLPIDCSPWVEMSMRYAEWLRCRGVRVAEDTVVKQFRDSVPGQEVLRLKWQGQHIPQLPLQDTDITESQLSTMGFSRFGVERDGHEGVAVDIQDVRSRVIGEVKTMRYGHVGVEVLPWQTGKVGKKQVLARVYPVEVADHLVEFPRGRMLFTTLCLRISDRLRYKIVHQHDVKGAGDLCGCVAAKLGWPAKSYADMKRVVAAMLGQIATLTDLSWKWRVMVEANLSLLQQTLDSCEQGVGANGPSVWQQYGNLGLFELGGGQVSDDDFREQVAFLETLVTAMIGQGGEHSKRLRVAFRIDDGFIICRDDMTCEEVRDMTGGVWCVIGKHLEDTVYQFVDISDEVGNHIIKGMQECAHTVAEAVVTQSSWRDHSLSWYHKEWKLRAQWVQVAWRDVGAMDVCSPPWTLRKSQGRGEVARRQKRPQSVEEGPSPRASTSHGSDLYEVCKLANHITRLGFTESILADRIVVSGFHASCLVSEVVRQILIVLKLALLPAEESQVQRGVSQGGSETSAGMRVYIIQLRQAVLFRTRLDKGAAYFFSLLSDPLQVTYGKAQRKERFMIMVSPCPRWITDLRQPAFVSRGYAGVDLADMGGVGALGWALRSRFPSEVGELAFIRVQIRVGFLVSMPGSSATSLLRHANETIVLHFSTGGVQQLSVWSWLERQQHWKVDLIHTPKQGKSGRVLLREAGSRYDLWKSCKHIIGSGHEHILASADVVGPRAVTILSCRKGASPSDESFPQLLQLWESQAVNLAAISSIGWASSKFEGAKGRKRAHNRPSHLSIVWAGDMPEEVQIVIPELPGSQLDMEAAECVEGMWRSSFGLDGNSISLIPGNIRSYFMMRGQTLLPKRNAIINDLLGRGWGTLLDIPQLSVSFTPQTPLRSALKRSISYANAVGECLGSDREEASTTTQESASGSEHLDESKTSVSTLSSIAGDDKVWREISKLRADMDKLQRTGDSSALVMEDRVHCVEAATRLLQTQQEQTAVMLSEVKRDGLQVAQAVDRMEGRLTETAGCIREIRAETAGCMREIRDLLQRQHQPLPPMWMNPASMLDYYRAQIQSVSQHGLVIQDGQRLHGALQDQGTGADKDYNNG